MAAPSHAHPRAGRFIGFATDADSRQAIAMAAAAQGWAAPDVREGGLEAAHAFLSSEPAPAFLVIDLSAARAPLPAVDALADVCAAETRVLAIGTQNDVELFRGLLALGVGDYLLKPVDMKEIGAALDRMMERPPEGQGRTGASARQATVAAFLGSRGGAGATALAAAAASCLARSGQRVALIDLDLQGGSLALDLASDPSPALLQILEAPDRVDPVVVEQALRPHPLGFRLLAVDAPIEAVPTMEGDALMALVAATMEMADVVVLDCPRWLDRTRRAVLRMVDRVVIVTPPTLPGLRDTRRVARLMQSLRAGQQPLLVGNRVGASAAELSRADFQQGLGQALDLWLPEEAAAARHAAERGLTLHEGASRRLAAGLHRLADSLVPQEAPSVETPSLLEQVGRLFGKGSGR
jgi:pilus assembly protein CpaE